MSGFGSGGPNFSGWWAKFEKALRFFINMFFRSMKFSRDGDERKSFMSFSSLTGVRDLKDLSYTLPGLLFLGSFVFLVYRLFRYFSGYKIYILCLCIWIFIGFILFVFRKKIIKNRSRIMLLNKSHRFLVEESMKENEAFILSGKWEIMFSRRGVVRKYNSKKGLVDVDFDDGSGGFTVKSAFYIGSVEGLRAICDEGFGIGLVLLFESRRYHFGDSTKTIDFVSVAQESMVEYDRRKKEKEAEDLKATAVSSDGVSEGGERLDS